MKKQTEVKFDAGIKTVHVPFLPGWGAFDSLRYEISRIKYPKSAGRIEASITVIVDLEGDMDYELGEVRVYKKATTTRTRI